MSVLLLSSPFSPEIWLVRYCEQSGNHQLSRCIEYRQRSPSIISTKGGDIAGKYSPYPQYRTPKYCEYARVSAVSNTEMLEVEKGRIGTLRKEPQILRVLAV